MRPFLSALNLVFLGLLFEEAVIDVVFPRAFLSFTRVDLRFGVGEGGKSGNGNCS